jgi:DNA-binding NarL/FixJ family response regulator
MTRASGLADIGRVRDDSILVLVVDDLASARLAAVEVVKATEGFEIAGAASSGEEAIEFLSCRPVDLVLLDAMMPGIGGAAACLHIRRLWPATVVVLLSVYRSDDLPEEVREVAAGHCAKDRFGPEQLETLWRDGSTRV